MISHSRSAVRLKNWPSVGVPTGFTLIELLAVILIIGVLVGTSASYFQGSMSAMRISSEGTQLESMLSAAQQAASAEGRNIEVRFYQHADPAQLDGAKRFRSVVLLRYYQAGDLSPDPNAAGTVLTKPMAVVMGENYTLGAGVLMASDSSLSSLLGAATSPGSTTVDTKILSNHALDDWKFPVSDSDYHSFVIRPEGTSLNPAGKWFVTIVSNRDEEGGASAGSVKNFYCVQIDPVNGRVVSYRP